MNFKRSELMIIFFPSVIMVLITLISFSNIFEALISHGIFVLSLMLIFPLSFFIQGVLGGYSTLNVHIALSISLVTFIVIVAVALNSSAYVYVPLYLLTGLMGYGLALLFKKI